MRVFGKVVKSILFTYLLTGFLTALVLVIDNYFFGFLPLHLIDGSAGIMGYWAYPMTVLYVTFFWGQAVFNSVLALLGMRQGLELPLLFCIILVGIFVLFFLFFMMRRSKRK